MGQLKKTIKEYATRYNVSEKTIQRWIKSNAPLDNEEAIKLWRIQKDKFTATKFRQNKSAGIVEDIHDESSSKEEDSNVVYEKQIEGVAASLKRLEASEALSYTRFQQALQTGNELKIRLARDEWLAISKALREYDVLVEKSRRDGGDLIPRENAEKFIELAAVLCRISFQDFMVDVVPKILELKSAYDIQKEMEHSMRESFLNACKLHMICNSSMEEWAYKSLKKGYCIYDR
jgi:hypothetical protein